MISLGPHFPPSRPATLLLLGAHSDDIEIGCGGTIMTLAEKTPTAHIHWVVFGAHGARKDEARQSASDLLTPFASSKIETFGFKDAFFPHFAADIKDCFENLKKDVSPDIILTHHRDDLHQDHRIIGEFTWNTFRDHFILEYEIPKYDAGLGSPNCFMPLSESVVSRKCDHLTTHFASQRDQHWFTHDLFRGVMRLRGVECRSPSGFAEGFYSRKTTLSWDRP